MNVPDLLMLNLPLGFSRFFTAASAHALAASTVSTANPTMWYLTRAAATCAYIALTLTVLLGIARSFARVQRLRRTWLLEEIHRYVANATVAFVAVHLTTLLLDPLIPFTPLNVLLPVNEPYRPLAVAVGVFALYVLVLVIASSWLRRSFPYGPWRLLHYGSFAAFWLATLHGLLVGSDASQDWMRQLYLWSAAFVAVGMLVRLFWGSGESNQGATYTRSSVRRGW